MDAKNVEPVDGDAPQVVLMKMLDGTCAGKPSAASTELLDGKSTREATDQSVLVKDALVMSEAERGG